MDISKLLRLLNEHNVRYVVVGSMALPTHGFVRTTQDIDLLIEPMRQNAERAWLALQEFGYDLSDITVDEMLAKSILIRQYIVASDIHPEVLGVTFDEVWLHRVADEIEGTPVFVAGLDDLLKMKLAANRPKDQEDIRVLKRLKERRTIDANDIH